MDRLKKAGKASRGRKKFPERDEGGLPWQV
jgi:hypothetical protein